MIVLTLSDCPPSLRGDLTKWLFEVNTGVFVGRLSARVRDALWERVIKHIEFGHATMVYNFKCEQGFDFRVYNTHWQPIDFDGLKLMMRPKTHGTGSSKSPRLGYSNASKRLKAKKHRRVSIQTFPSEYVVIDLETTGVSAASDHIIELSAMRVNGEQSTSFSTLIAIERALPLSITALTGITSSMLRNDGVKLESALAAFIDFIGDLPLVSHNVAFDLSFLEAACKRCQQPKISNYCIDTMSIAKRQIDDLDSYSLASLLAHFDITHERLHRGLSDCLGVKKIYVKLIEN